MVSSNIPPTVPSATPKSSPTVKPTNPPTNTPIKSRGLDTAASPSQKPQGPPTTFQPPIPSNTHNSENQHTSTNVIWTQAPKSTAANQDPGGYTAARTKNPLDTTTMKEQTQKKDVERSTKVPPTIKATMSPSYPPSRAPIVMIATPKRTPYTNPETPELTAPPSNTPLPPLHKLLILQGRAQYPVESINHPKMKFAESTLSPTNVSMIASYPLTRPPTPPSNVSTNASYPLVGPPTPPQPTLQLREMSTAGWHLIPLKPYRYNHQLPYKVNHLRWNAYKVSPSVTKHIISPELPNMRMLQPPLWREGNTIWITYIYAGFLIILIIWICPWAPKATTNS